MAWKMGRRMAFLAALSGVVLALAAAAPGAQASALVQPGQHTGSYSQMLALTGDDLIADIGVVLGKGYDVTGIAITSGPMGGDFLAISGTAIESADGYNQWVFFFDGTSFVGTDTAAPSTSLALAGSGLDNAGNGVVRVSYANYAADDPLCCPSLAPVVITYTWDGTNLTPSGTPPGH